MKNISKKYLWLIFITSCVTIFALMFAYVAGADVFYKFKHNPDGMSYGSSLDVEYGFEPDLIAATATNGQEGYVLKTDLLRAEGEVSGPEEAVEMMEEYHAAASRVFADTLSRKLKPKTVISDEKALAVYQEILDFQQLNRELVSLSATEITKISDTIGKKLSLENDIPAEVLDEAIDAADRANVRCIPVYEIDGKTRIGVFEIF